MWPSREYRTTMWGAGGAPLLPESISISKYGPSEDPHTDTQTPVGGSRAD